MPGLFFSAYQQVVFYSNTLVSKDQYKAMLNHYIGDNEDLQKRYKYMTAGAEDEILQKNLFVKLNPDITDTEREYLANGLRAYLSKLTFLIDVKARVKSINVSIFLFQIFVGIVGTVALIISFFLLLISTTANIRENVWEYGVLRSMGVTKKTGIRIFLYESLSVVTASLILGSIVGVAIAFTLAA